MLCDLCRQSLGLGYLANIQQLRLPFDSSSVFLWFLGATVYKPESIFDN
jgi:hypothetical protein